MAELTQDRPAQCLTCRRLANLIFEHLDAVPSDDEDGVSVDSLGDVGFKQVPLDCFGAIKQRAAACPACLILVRQVLRRQSHAGGVSDDALCDLVLPYGSTEIHATFGNLSLTMLPTLTATRDLQRGPHPFARPVPDTIDIDRLKTCIRRCEEQHGSECSDGDETAPREETPRLLIDVEDACIVPATLGCRYVALSYVWGQAKVTRSLAHNIKLLMQIGSLSRTGIRVPATIRDAMLLTSRLGERYRWVDAFCIIQDDDADKKAQLNAMGDFYRRAAFTIIAHAGDHADYGLPGVPGAGRARAQRADYVEFSPGRAVYIVPEHMSSASVSPWHQRAWTFQEALFSARTITVNETVKWNCRCIAVSEPVATPEEGTPAFAITDNNHWHHWLGYQPTPAIPRWPDAIAYMFQVEEFNQRKLTYDADVLDAFAGTLSTMDRYFQDGFHFGMPELIFEVAMLWQPLHPLRRRIDGKAPGSAIPSWSWVGWEGQLDHDLFISACDWLGTDVERMIEVVPTVSAWNYHPPGQEEVTCSVQTGFHRYRERFASNIDYPNPSRADHSLPEGWTEGEKSLYGGARYSHSAVSQDIARHFAYPLPQLNTRPKKAPHDRHGHLHFDTTTATLLLGDPIASWPPTRRRMACDIDLRTPEGRWAGTLRCNATAEDMLRGEAETPRVKLVAISLGKVRQDSMGANLGEWEHEERPRDSDSGFYEFYNVLWIREEAGTSSRRALGRVLRDIWEAASSDIHVKLG